MSQSSFKFHTNPLADPQAVISEPGVRFTVLTSRLLRLEFDSSNRFEDHASQAFWYRLQPVPNFSKHVNASEIQIETDDLLLTYQITPAGFTRNTLSIQLKKMGITWHYGDPNWDNLLGTTRTLDEANGAIHLEPGLMSRKGWAVVNDSRGLVFNEEGWLQPRATDKAQDLYFFGFGHDYLGCLQDFSKVAGRTPMIPRWILGNWWSRYWPYRQDELKSLVEDFKAHEIPLGICIIDMDWHITQTGNASSGWTGYTWNRELWPDPYGFIHWLHAQGVHTALNLHPADGVYPHEEQYPQMAEAMGIDPATQEPVSFDISDPKFMRNYFDILHHPMEEKGVDFWWLDWQQGTESKVANLDPLWFLNHLHFLDSGRSKQHRPFVFSRWGGLGNHRYPIGFSGDSIVTWESLAFQPYFTSTAANVGYGWWSHDIGGHQRGFQDRELYARWVQFGVFSPILRLHSTFNNYIERRPWGYDSEVLNITRDALQLRHTLIPYIYSMAWRNVQQCWPLITPMYYNNPEDEDAYRAVDQYAFGSELVAAPFVTPANPDTHLSRGSVWLPSGDWFNFFTGEYYAGQAWYALFGDLNEIPIFAKAGAIVPLAPKVAWNGIDNPAELMLNLFPGASHRFELYEDDGSSQQYKNGSYGLTAFEQKWFGDHLQFIIEPVTGDASVVPASRGYTLIWKGITQPVKIEISLEGKALQVQSIYDAANETLTLQKVELNPAQRLVVTLQGVHLSKRDRRKEKYLKALYAFHCNPDIKKQVEARYEEFLKKTEALTSLERQLSEAQLGTLLQILKN